MTVTLTVREKLAEEHALVLDCAGRNQLDQPVLEGAVRVVAPTRKIRRQRAQLPDVELRRLGGFERLMSRCKGLGPVSVAVAHPCDSSSLSAAVEASRREILAPILVGPESRIRAVAEETDIDLSGVDVVDAAHSHESAALAVEQVREGRAELVMKGSLHTDELMEAVVSRANGLRTERRISHAFIMDVATRSDVLIVTDGAINIAPDLEAKRDICQNAIDLAHALDIEEPRVAILSAVETVTGRIPSTLDAASLCKMADRGQITGGLLDGPLAFDNAISVEAARIKKIKSPVAGRANILVAPDLESGNILAKQLTFMAKADAAGVVLGARVPIILTSRADTQRTKLASCAIAAIMAHFSRDRLPKVPKGPNG
jgi:phosphate butyryltransferase